MYASTASVESPLEPYFESEDQKISLYQGDCLEVMAQLPAESVDLIFADPPYFLSNGGMTCKSGKMASVHKGKWDESRGIEANHEFNRRWLSACQRLLKPNGTMFVSGTRHVIFSVGFAMQQLGLKMLNDITWYKVTPPPNLSCRYFVHSTETILWAAKNSKSKHFFAYKDMREENGGKQMQSLWHILPPLKAEKRFGKHPTQKPIALLERIVRAAGDEDCLVLDPFNGGGTTGVASARLGRNYIGIELDEDHLKQTIARLGDLDGERKQPAARKGKKRGQAKIK
jgi:site-specific DNA-methyltransferase (adenine-specific)